MNINLSLKNITIQTFILTGKIEDKNILNNLKNYIKNVEIKNLIKDTHVKGSMTGFKSLIHNEDFHKFITLIREEIKLIYKDNFIIQDVWGNICKKNEKITEHHHNGITAFCGILYLTEGGSGTFFKQYDLLIKEEVGRYVLFHPMLLHSVEDIKDDIERISLAFNMNDVKSWDYDQDIKWINKNV
jgi:hypothetical protein